ncbi:F-box protein [Parachlamydia sp. AcF125]|uniref:F-box protein n=1 Tax=Parachlamydia sp. AcF125 TaxID=2795736 RepID=UPI001BC945A5|nr:F-box protein [Parachlamydia sp. AcF125]MBS4168538.1 hypothetical protein [Parachlamydia sp. AcF125]
MSFLIANNLNEFRNTLAEIKSISDTPNLYLTTKLTSSTKLKMPLKVAEVVCELAEKNQRFLTSGDKDTLVNIVKRIESKAQYAKGKEKEEAFVAIIEKIKSLNLPQVISGLPFIGNTNSWAKPNNVIKQKHIPNSGDNAQCDNPPPKRRKENRSLNLSPSLELEDLPQEIFEQILSALGGEDYKNCSEVNKKWNTTLIQVAKRKEAFLLCKLIQCVMDHCDSQKAFFFDAEQNASWLSYDYSSDFWHENLKVWQENLKFWHENLKDLEKIKNSLNLSASATLIQLASSLFCEKIKFLFVLTRYPEYCKELKERAQVLELPWLFKGIFDPATHYYPCIWDGISKLVRKNLLGKALEIAHNLSDEDEKGKAFSKVSILLAEAGHLDKALEIGHTIPHEYKKSKALAKISILFTKAGHLEKALEIVKTIPGEFEKNYALSEISILLAESGQFIKALECVNANVWESEKDYALSEISTLLAESGQLDKSLEIAKTISDEKQRNAILIRIASKSAETGQLDKSLEIAMTIRGEDEKDYALSEISTLLAETGQFEKAQEIAKTISHEEHRKPILFRIASISAKTCQVEKV